ncbi:hypothetical protein [Leptospira ellinghausenii]|nr:hypothetical protein [Leptospira ellinghausenii]
MKISFVISLFFFFFFNCELMTIRSDHSYKVSQLNKSLCWGGKFNVQYVASVNGGASDDVKKGVNKAIALCENNMVDRIDITIERSTDDESLNYGSFIFSLFLVPLLESSGYQIKVVKNKFISKGTIVLSRNISPWYIFLIPNYFFGTSHEDLIFEEVLNHILEVEEQEKLYAIEKNRPTVSSEKKFRNVFRECSFDLYECAMNEAIKHRLKIAIQIEKKDNKIISDLAELRERLNTKEKNFAHGCFCRTNPDPNLFSKCPVESDFDSICEDNYNCNQLKPGDNSCGITFWNQLIKLEKKLKDGKFNDYYLKEKIKEQLAIMHLKIIIN